MANRAYLYAADEPPDIWRHPDEPYCGSPWVIPLAWFFFYEAADIRMVPVHYRGSSWREVKLVAEKQRAVQTFSARQRLLPSTTNQRVDMDAVLTFLTAVKNWPGLHLLLDPGEVLGAMVGDDDWHGERFGMMLSLLDSTSVTPAAITAAVRPYVGNFSVESEAFLAQVFGYSYG